MTLTQTLEQQTDHQVAREATSSIIPLAVYPHPDESYPDDLVMTQRELVGRRVLRKGQELYCSYIERPTTGMPELAFALNFTKNYKKTKAVVGAQTFHKDTVQWQNTVANLGIMGRTLNRLPRAETVYCVGSGPALMRNWHWLEKVKGKPGVQIIGCNELLQYLPAGLLDYYMAMDWACPERWVDKYDLSRTTAIFGPYVTPSFPKYDWKDVLWFRMGYRNDLNEMVSSKRPDLTIINPLYGVGTAELEVAWHMRPKNIVLVGHSYAYDRIDGVIYEHINEPLTENRWEGALRGVNHYFTTDIFGKPIVTDYHILITAMMCLTCCQMLADAGIRVINATEGGILKSNPELPAYRNRPSFPEPARLEDVVKEL